MSVRSFRSVVRTLNPLLRRCSTHCEQHPQVGVLNTSTNGPAAGFCCAAIYMVPSSASAATANASVFSLIIGPPYYDILKRHAQAPVDDAPFERRPGVDGPSPVAPRARYGQRVELCLPNVEQIFRVEKHAQAAETPLGECAKQEMRATGSAIGIFVETLRADEVHLDA